MGLGSPARGAPRGVSDGSPRGVALSRAIARIPRDRAIEIAILLVALAVRLPTLTAALPYMSYVDEGHVLHRSLHLLAARTWEPDTYSYPTLPFYLVAGAALAYAPLHQLTHERTLREDLSPVPPVYYDILEPPELIVAARLVTLLFSLGVAASQPA